MTRYSRSSKFDYLMTAMRTLRESMINVRREGAHEVEADDPEVLKIQNLIAVAEEQISLAKKSWVKGTLQSK